MTESKDKAPKVIRSVYAVRGMTCRSCELLVEQRLSKVPGVVEVRASERRGEVEIFASKRMGMERLQEALEGTEYVLGKQSTKTATAVTNDTTEPPRRHWMEVGGMLILAIALYQLLKYFNIVNTATNLEGALSLGTVFAVGIVAALSSCMALTGGLLLSISAKWAEAHPDASRWEKFQPLMLFNMGRLAGYFLLGGVIGAIGRAVTLTPHITGLLTVIIAIVMVMLGLNILRILPKQYCTIPLPRSFRSRLQRLSASQNPATPLVLGALTFFLPCGFTQSMQLYALGSGGFLQGSAIMLVFALGTLPSLLGISIMSSIMEGRGARWFLQFAGAIVLLLGLSNLQSGLLLTGVDAAGALQSILPWSSAPARPDDQPDPYVSIDPQGRQVVAMYVSDAGYSPSAFTIDAGRETWIYAIAEKPVGGCASQLVDASHNLSVPIRVGGNWLGPIQNPQRDFVLTCSMGMFRADVRVK